MCPTDQGSPKRRVIIWSQDDDPSRICDMDVFRAFAEKAAELGATHVAVSEVIPSRWQMKDPRDPHPEWSSWPVWSMRLAGLFKIAVPPGLEEWLPTEEAERNLDFIRQRCEILRSLGLRAAFSGNDPMWLPEAVYRAHPEWRGAQGELLCIARVPYFSPCVDHPEVLDMYRWAMSQLCQAAPELDFFSAFTNDSAGGLCWSGSYPGNNGPEWCRHRTLTERVVGFLTALQDGARQAGCELAVNLSVQSVPPAVDRTRLLPGQFYNGRDAQGRPWGSGMGGSNTYFSNHMFPVLGIPRVLSFAEEMEHAVAADTGRVSVSMGQRAEEWLYDVYREMLATPTQGLAGRMQVLRRVAASRVGEEMAEALLAVWQQIERAVECVRHVRGWGYSSVMLVGAAMMRWAITPLVPDLSRLSPEDKAFWQKGKVATNEVEANSYHAMLGRRGVIGSAAVWMAQNSLNEAIQHAHRAAQGAEALIEHAQSDRARHHLEALVYRLKALACLFTTCRNFIQYEEQLARRGPEEMEVVWRDHTGTYGISRAGVELRAIARSEVDNTYELANLIESAPEPILPIAPVPEEEDSFVFAPNVVEQLRRKAEIMLDRWEDYNELYPAPPPVEEKQDADDRRPGPQL